MPTTGPVVKNHISPQMAKESIAIKRTTFHSLSLVCRRVPLLPSPASSTSSSQDTVISTENPATERSEITSEESRGNPARGSAETENTNENEDDEELRSELLQDVPEWLQDFKENLVDQNFQPHQYSPSSSHELPMEPRAKVVPGRCKHSICTHCPKYRNCDICLRTKITRGSCRRRAGPVVPKWEIFGDFVTADHKVLSEGCESRNYHRYAVLWYRIWQLSGYNSTRAKQKLRRKHRGACKSSWNPRGNQKSFTLTIP